MKSISSPIPEESYGVLYRDSCHSALDEAVEQIKRLGFAVIDSGLTSLEIHDLSNGFDRTYMEYIAKFGRQRLESLNEIHTIRAMMTHGDHAFIRLATNRVLIKLISRLINGKFILNQQNGVINPPGETYNQAAWHRDLPYQHFVSSTPLAINALFCIDDFTAENGATFVLPSSHRSESFPSESYIMRNAIQIEAKAGQFIVLDCMLFHSGGFNDSKRRRRAVNHVYTIPYFKQQVKLPALLENLNLSPEEKDIFGFSFTEPISVDQLLDARAKK
jgi:ectoine hydroxylase-related dioxygenase (phytanoyl-CoA dioxygenase family)